MWCKPNGDWTDNSEALVPLEDWEFEQGILVPLDGRKKPDRTLLAKSQAKRRIGGHGKAIDSAAKRIVQRMKELGL